MKKYLSTLAIIALAICLVSFAFDRIVPASTAHAASESQPASTGPTEEKTAVSLSGSAQPVVFVVTGLVCALFGIIAVTPMLIEDPAQLINEADRAEQETGY